MKVIQCRSKVHCVTNDGCKSNGCNTSRMRRQALRVINGLMSIPRMSRSWNRKLTKNTRAGRSLENLYGLLWQVTIGKRMIEVSWKHKWFKDFMVISIWVTPRRRTILICVCGRHKTGWEETKHWPNVESTYERLCRFGRTNILPWTTSIWVALSTRMQRYCGQLQKCLNPGSLQEQKKSY